MKLNSPFPVASIDNPFGGSTGAVLAYYKSIGLDGHPGDDYEQDYGTPIPCAADCVVSSILSEGNPDLMAFRAVNTIVEDSTGCFEVQYGHISTTTVKVGQQLKAGDIVANVGNTGDVFSCNSLGCAEVTEAQKLAGSHAGSHLHFQVRVLIKVPVSQPQTPGSHYLNDGSGELVINGFKYLVPNFDNGFDGCVDPMAFFGANSFVFNNNLFLGQNNTDVLQLQKRLGVYPQSGFFGTLTFAAVTRYQSANGITPSGFVGPITRARLNSTG